MKVKIKYFSEGIEKIKFVEGNKSNWIDLRAAEEVILHKGDFMLIPLGVAMELPKGYEAIIAPRSSTFKNYGIIQTNSIGVIDELYCGDDDQWYLPVYCLSPKHFKDGQHVTIIEKGDRICQFRIIERMSQDTEFEVVESLGNENRNGIGSTGTK